MWSKLKEKLKSIRVKLFLTLCIVVTIIIVFLIILNNIVLETFYLYTKTQTLKQTFFKINSYYNADQIETTTTIEAELEKIAINNNFDILIKTDTGLSIYTSDRDFLSTIGQINAMSQQNHNRKTDVIYEDDDVNIKRSLDLQTGLNYILLTSILDNGYQLYIRTPMASIQESVRISNNFLYLIGGITIVIAGIIVSFISKRFTEPILELNSIANNMSKLDFSKKYDIKDTDDEVNNLGKSINIMSDKLETTIKQLKETNNELEKDIEEKSKIDEMRKQFISDVSHELKTPIALIQGYAEGLQENIITDEESRKFYTEVILDEANKMDKLVKELLELMKLEYGKREFNNKKFDIIELINEVIRKAQVMLKENDICVEFEQKEPIYVFADDFYIEQVITNYFTNAVKHVKKINNERVIKISIKNIEEDKIRISVFNTGDKIKEENINKIWSRFYKEDVSRNREDGGTGVGLSLVKAIMNNYQNKYGVINREDGVEFYFELEMPK